MFVQHEENFFYTLGANRRCPALLKKQSIIWDAMTVMWHHYSEGIWCRFFLDSVPFVYISDCTNTLSASRWCWRRSWRWRITGLFLISCNTRTTATDRARIMMTSSNGNIFRVTGPLCGEFTGPGEFPTQRPVTRSFDVYFDLRLNKRLSKQPWGWWFETPS